MGTSKDLCTLSGGVLGAHTGARRLGQAQGENETWIHPHMSQTSTGSAAGVRAMRIGWQSKARALVVQSIVADAGYWNTECYLSGGKGTLTSVRG